MHSLYALRVVINGKPRIVGKVVQVGKGTMFYRKYPEEVALLRKERALSLDARVAEWLDREGVEGVYYDGGHGCRFISLATFKDKHYESDNGEGRQWYLHEDEWETVPQVRPDFTPIEKDVA